MTSLGLTKEQTKMVFVLLSGAVLVVLNQTLLSPALPSIMEHLNVGATTVQWLTSAYALTEAVVIPLAAWFMGRFSTRVLFIGGMGGFALGSLVAAIAPVFPVLLIGRILQASVTGILMAMVMALILLSFPRESRGAAMGIVSLVIGFAPAVGPTLGGVLVDLIGWRALFCVVVFFSLVVILCASRVLTNYEAFPRTRFDVVSVVFSSLGLASLLYGLSSFASTDHVEVCIGLIIFGVFFVLLFGWRQFRLDEPLLRLEILKSRRYRTGAIAVMFLQAVLIGLGVLMPLYIQNVLGFSATVSGLVTLPGAVIGAFAGLLAGRIFDRYGVRYITVVGSVILLIGGVGMIMYESDSPIWFVLGINIIVSLSVQLLITPINTWGVNSLGNELVQHATSVTNTINQIGASLGTALIMSFTAIGSSMAASQQITGIEQEFAGDHLAFIVVLIFLVLIFLLVLIGVRNRKSDVVLQASTPSPVKEGQYRVEDVMSTDLVAIPVTATLSEATQALAESGGSGAIINDEDKKVCGFISNSDVLRYFSDEVSSVTGLSGFSVIRLYDNEKVKDRVARMSGIKAIDVATKKVIGIEPDALFEDACTMLAEKRLKQLPVIQEGKLVGVVHRKDLMEFLTAIMKEDAAESRNRNS